MRSTLFVIALLSVFTAAQSQVYKWQDANGQWHFSTSPPEGGGAEVVPAIVNKREKATGQKTWAHRQHELREQFADSPYLDEILKGQVAIGMKEAEVMASLGTPVRRNDTITARGKHSQWVYADRYVYLENGVVTTIQEQN